MLWQHSNRVMAVASLVQTVMTTAMRLVESPLLLLQNYLSNHTVTLLMHGNDSIREHLQC
jgi:hypothetical protein